MKTFLIFFLALLIAGCSNKLETSDKIEFDPTDIQYVKDNRTNLCFAYVSTQEASEPIYSEGIGIATVTCDSIPTFLLK